LARPAAGQKARTSEQAHVSSVPQSRLAHERGRTNKQARVIAHRGLPMNAQARFEKGLGRLNQHLPLSTFIYSIHISLRYSYIYVECPKCACTTIKSALIRMELGDKDYMFDEPGDIHLRDFSPLLSPRQVGAFEERLRSPFIVKFCFVRNPYSRLLSAYLDKIAQGKPIFDIIRKQLGHGQAGGLSIGFDEFVQAVIHQPVSMMDSHWRTQYHQTLQDVVPYSFIGKVENLDEDIARLGSLLGADLTQFMRDEVDHATQADEKMARYYTTEMQNAVYEKYRIDFENFGYDRELPA
jgi:hypothetical protein